MNLGVRVKINDYCTLERYIMYDKESKEYLARLYFLRCETKRRNIEITTEVAVNLILNHVSVTIEKKRVTIKDYGYAMATVERANKITIDPLIDKNHLNKLVEQLEQLYKNTMRRGDK